MKRRTVNLLFLLGALIFMALFCMFIAYGVIQLAVPVDTPFAQFQDLQPETPLKETYYEIDYANQNIILKNTISQATQPIIQRYSPVALPPAYQLLRHANRIYLMIRLASGGNSGALWFKVFNVSTSPAVDLMQKAVAPQSGISCTIPQVDLDALVFEFSTNCADIATARQTYRVSLN